VPVDATYNWWGNISGPKNLTNPGGSGEIVSSYVTYSPFATASIFPVVPVIDSCTPDNGINTGIISAAITAMICKDGLTVKLSKSGQSDILAANVSFISATSITCQFNIAGARSGSGMLWLLIRTAGQGL